MTTAQTLPVSLADFDETEVTASATPAPRTRWAAIIWGLFFAAVAWLGLWLLNDAERRAGVTDTIATLTPDTLAAVVLLTVGVLVLVTGLVGLLRRAQRAHSTRS